MRIKNILNDVHPIKGFVYDKFNYFGEQKKQLEVTVVPDKRSKPICSVCGRRGPTYDTARHSRRFDFVPLWNIPVVLLYQMRRVNCSTCGVKTERVPWSEGKHHTTDAYRCFLASWAKLLSWQVVARQFDTTWDTVYRSVGHVVDFGLKNRSLDGIETIGVDEVKRNRPRKFVTLVYQLDEGRKRLLHIEDGHNTGSFRKFFTMLDQGERGENRRSRMIKYVCSDMWKPYMNVIRRRCPDAIHVLDRFHIKKKFNEAVNSTRIAEVKRLKDEGYEPKLTNCRWLLLKNKSNHTSKEAVKLRDLLGCNLRTIRAWILADDFEQFWEYTRPSWAKKFLKQWCTRAMRSRIEPMKEVARMLRRHAALILNYFKSGKLSSGPVEGLNTKVKLVMRMSYGFRTLGATKTAPYHRLGDLPEPEFTHRFC
jgi:transposase